MLLLFHAIGFDLANAGNVIVQERIHFTRGVADGLVASLGGQGVNEGTGGQQRNGDEGDERQLRADVKEVGSDREDLQHGDEALLHSIDQHPLHAGHVLGDGGHEVAGGLGIEPGQGKLLEAFVERTTDVADDALLQGVVQQNAQGIEQVPTEIRQQRESGHGEQGLGSGMSVHAIDDLLNGVGRNPDNEGSTDGAEQLQRDHAGIATDVGENAENGHGAGP